MLDNNKNFRVYLMMLLIFNIMPFVTYLSGIWQLKQIGLVYWAECTILAAFAVAVYLRYLIVFFLLLLSLGSIVYLANPGFLAGMDSIFTFWALYSLCWLSYIEIGKSSYGQDFKKLKHEAQLLIYLVFMCTAIFICMGITEVVTGSWAGSKGMLVDTSQYYTVFIIIAILVPTVSIGLLRVIDMIGQKHFLELVLGTYHTPVERERIVLFLDMAGSSAMAEKLGPTESMKLIARFIYDCSFVLRINNGDIINYTGDGLAVLWPTNQANNVLMAIRQLKQHFSSKAVRRTYWQPFGMVPEFRIGVHAGKIILNQIGEEKLFIGFYGDVVNTAARIEQLNKTLGTSVLLSEEVLKNGINKSWKALLKPMGEHNVRGKDESVRVYSIYTE